MDTVPQVSKNLFTNPALLAEMEKNARIKHFERDTVLMQTGDEVSFVPIVISGSLRILRQNDDGQEVFLYHIYPGQTCAMSVTCCQTTKKSMVKAVAEDDTTLLQIPSQLVDEWFKYPEWKTFINNNYSNRFTELLQAVDLVAFSNMDMQLLHYLKERCKAHHSNTLDITHQQIAEELHTHREAISRLLRTMEQKGLVKLGRNSIELL